jgi:NitT/TauT family transport system substrate-binding protein
MDLKYPESVVWYIEGRKNSHDENAKTTGSGVVVWLKKKGEEGRGRRYLLTCAHVLRGVASESAAKGNVAGYGPLLEDIRVWQPGEGFSDEAALAAKIAHEIKKLEPGIVPLTSRVAVDDWALLDVEDETFRISAPAMKACADPGSAAMQIIGYPGGSEGFHDHTVRPCPSHNIRFKDMHERVVRLYGDETRPGMSGGGLFDKAGRLVGIHRARLDRILECHSLSASYIREMLFAAGYEIIENKIDPAAEEQETWIDESEAVDEGRVAGKAWWARLPPSDWSRRALLAGVIGGAITAGYLLRSRRTQIKIGIKGWIGYAPLVVAAKMDLCSNVDVSFIAVKDIADAKDKVQSGEIHGGAWLAATHVIYRSERNPARVVLKLDESYELDGIVVRSGINKVHDLKGRKVAIQKFDAGHCILLALCGSDVKISEIELDAVTPDSAPHHFANNPDIVAVSTYEPYLSDILKLVPDSKVLWRGKDIGAYGIIDVLAFHNVFLERNEDAVRSLIEGWYKAVQLLKSHDPTAIKIACRFLGEGPTNDPTVYNAPMSEKDFKSYILDENVKLADREQNESFFRRDANDRSKFRDHYEFYEKQWGGSQLGPGSTNFFEADGSQPFITHRRG